LLVLAALVALGINGLAWWLWPSFTNKNDHH
jgi:hypothetical protein